ncbi:MAG: CoA transferase [Gammaproteobacteria bacterium]|nr:MAG: CoA transferase [Chloroflexota bacterium]TDJ23498.1 MAG: CoA transferase [Gammaproteobacteria bacterium]TDJ37548.1 MAG: CoA transferase [Gammaproteobacteria bacterium]
MSGPLTGFKVLDLSAVVSGPLAATLLADQGAEVIKVERLEGDIQRHVGSNRNGFSGLFHVLNRGKRSIALDLGHHEGQGIVKRLAASSDVVIQNFRPGVVDRLGVGYDTLRADNPGLVYLSISGFGQNGPRADERAYDPIIQFYSGIAAVQGRIDKDNPDQPQQVNQLILDKLTAYNGCQAITAGLLARSKTGKGQHIELSMLDVAIAFLWSDAAADQILLGDDDIVARPPIGAAGSVVHYTDGWGATMTLSDHEFAGLCRAYGFPEVADDPRFATMAERIKHRTEYAKVMREQVFPAAAKLSIAEAGARLKAQDVPFASARRLEELPEDEQIQHNEMFRELDHPIAGRLRDARSAPRFLGTPAAPGGPAPEVGQHTREILAEIGYAEAIDELLEAGVVHAS